MSQPKLSGMLANNSSTLKTPMSNGKQRKLQDIMNDIRGGSRDLISPNRNASASQEDIKVMDSKSSQEMERSMPSFNNERHVFYD